MTEIIYMKECYVKEWDAKVTFAEGKVIELDRTCFYPESGGQLSDGGTITASGETYNVIQVKKDKGRHLHELDKPGITPGTQVHCTLDWERRHIMMRMHTAAHVLARVIFDKTKTDITGNQLGMEQSRMDFNLPDFDRSLIAEFEKDANAAIQRQLPVKVYLLPREEAEKIPDLIRTHVSLLPEGINEIRIVEIEGFDTQACAGTHVANLGEIGKITITKAENKGKDNRRIYFTLQ